MSIIIKTEELETLFGLVIKKLREQNIDSLRIEDDYYWEITATDWNVVNEDPEIVVGSLIDDWKELQKCISNKEIISIIEFDRISSILKAISERIINSDFI